MIFFLKNQVNQLAEANHVTALSQSGGRTQRDLRLTLFSKTPAGDNPIKSKFAQICSKIGHLQKSVNLTDFEHGVKLLCSA